jgi:hypothetical protein
MNINGRFSERELNGTEKRFYFVQGNLQCQKKVFTLLRQLFMSYKMAYSRSLYLFKRAAQNRPYEKQCFQSRPFRTIEVLIGSNSTVNRWNSYFHKIF